MKKRFCFILPTYNYSKYISRAIDSILKPNGDDFELIVIDDGSTDNTASIIREKYEDKLTYIYQENMGPNAASIAGIRKSEADFHGSR